MSSWPQHLENPLALSGYFSELDDLDDLDVHSLELRSDGPCLELRADFMRFPDKPSPRWPECSNTAQVTLSFWSTGNLCISKWGRSNLCVLRVERTAQLVFKVSLVGAECSVQFTCGTLSLDRVSGYIQETS